MNKLPGQWNGRPYVQMWCIWCIWLLAMWIVVVIVVAGRQNRISPRIWPSNEIPVVCFNLADEVCSQILHALKLVEFATCLRFVTVDWRTEEHLHYLRFTSILYSDVSPTIATGHQPNICESQHIGLADVLTASSSSTTGNLLSHQDVVLGDETCANTNILIGLLVQALGVCTTDIIPCITYMPGMSGLFNRINYIYQCTDANPPHIDTPSLQSSPSISFMDFTRTPYL